MSRPTTTTIKSYNHHLYRTWCGIKQRCSNRTLKQYKDYGGRGIKVCDRWCKSFWDFVEDMGEHPKGTTLDRINNDGDYEPSNCKWSTPIEQAHNRRWPSRF